MIYGKSYLIIKIAKIAEENIVFKTLDNFCINIINTNKYKYHILNSNKFNILTKEQIHLRLEVIFNIENVIKNSFLSNIKNNKKPNRAHVNKYYYFKSKFKDKNNKYTIILICENFVNEEPQEILHLYDLIIY